MQRLQSLAFFSPPARATLHLSVIDRVNEYHFLANTITIKPSTYTFPARGYAYYTTTQPQTV